MMGEGRERLEISPCPDRILDDLGGAFSMGAIGGALWFSVKGFRNSPKGRRFRGAWELLWLRSPALGGSFAAWGGIYATYDCVFMHLRNKEDPYNSIASGGATGATLAFRAGPRQMAIQGLVGAAFLMFIEGLGILISKQFSRQAQQQDFTNLLGYGGKATTSLSPLPRPEELPDISGMLVERDSFDESDHDIVLEDDISERFEDDF